MRLAKAQLRPLAILAASLVLALTGCAGMANAPPDPMIAARDLAAACARSLCRTEVKEITLRAPGDNIARFKTDRLPYADNGTISIYPGESLAVRMSLQGQKLGEPVFEQSFGGAPPAKVAGYHADAEAKALEESKTKPIEALLYLHFTQDDKGAGMTLEVTSALPVTVKYDAVMFAATPQGIRALRTSSCPVLAGRADSRHGRSLLRCCCSVISAW